MAEENNEPNGIVVIEDNEELREVITEVLEQAEFMVESFAHPQFDFSSLPFTPKLFLIDAWIAGSKTGLQLAKFLKTFQDRYQDCAIIVMSSDHNIEDEISVSEDVFFLSKPFKLEQLLGFADSFLADGKQDGDGSSTRDF